MPEKVIKKDSIPRASVKTFTYPEDSDRPRAEKVALDMMPEEFIGNPPPPAQKDPSLPDLPAPAVDTAEVEKAAYENGFLHGEKAGMEIAEKKNEALMRTYAESILKLGKLKSALYEQVERDVVKLALEVAKKIVHREIQADREIIQTLVKVALNHVAEKSPVTVRLSPVDYNYLLDNRTALSRQGEGLCEVVLLADKSIQRGGCLVETECGDIDARIEEEFREVERVFFEGEKHTRT